MMICDIRCVSPERAELRNDFPFRNPSLPEVPRYRGECGGKRSGTPLFARALQRRQKSPPRRWAFSSCGSGNFHVDPLFPLWLIPTGSAYEDVSSFSPLVDTFVLCPRRGWEANLVIGHLSCAPGCAVPLISIYLHLFPAISIYFQLFRAAILREAITTQPLANKTPTAVPYRKKIAPARAARHSSPVTSPLSCFSATETTSLANEPVTPIFH
jgi:hypothetical protein